jgi:predicted CoA-binding protein
MHPNVLTSDDELRALLASTKRIAVLGIKPESRAGEPAHYVPTYLAGAGFDVVPVPVYYPEVTTILGKPVYRTLAAIPGDIDLVDVFRRSEHVAQHTADILAKKPRAVWMQQGIRDDAVAETLAQAGIKVVQDACIMVLHRRFAKEAR